MRSFPFDSLVVGFGDNGFPLYDRQYSSEDLREVYRTFFSNGVFLDTEDAFQVTPATDGMNVIVAPGKCHIDGIIGYEAAQRQLALPGASSQDMIATVVLRLNTNIEARSIDLYVRSGVAADVPLRPALVRNESVYELGIADVYIAKNTGTVTAQRITDTRLDTERCGMVTPLLKIDTTTFYNQLQAAIDTNVGELHEQTQVAVDLAQAAIDETLAGSLQSQITKNADDIASNSLEIEGIKEIDHVVESSNGGAFGQSWRRWSSGFVEIWGSALADERRSNNVEIGTVTFPFPMITTSAIATVSDIRGNAANWFTVTTRTPLDSNVNSRFIFWFQSSSGAFASLVEFRYSYHITGYIS